MILNASARYDLALNAECVNLGNPHTPDTEATHTMCEGEPGGFTGAFY